MKQWHDVELRNVMYVERKMKLFLLEMKTLFLLLLLFACTYFLIIHPLFVHEGGTVGSFILIFCLPLHPCARCERKIINFCLQFWKTIFFLWLLHSLLALPLWDFPRLSLFSVLIKLEHIFSRTWFRFARKSFIGNPFESDAVLVEIKRGFVCERGLCFIE